MTIKRWKMKFFNISRAFLRTPIRERVLLEPPAEYREYCIEDFGDDAGEERHKKFARVGGEGAGQARSAPDGLRRAGRAEGPAAPKRRRPRPVRAPRRGRNLVPTCGLAFARASAEDGHLF